MLGPRREACSDGPVVDGRPVQAVAHATRHLLDLLAGTLAQRVRATSELGGLSASLAVNAEVAALLDNENANS